MNRKMIAGELLCAALLLGCNAAPKLSVPSGEWVEIALPPQLLPPPSLMPTTLPGGTQGPLRQPIAAAIGQTSATAPIAPVTPMAVSPQPAPQSVPGAVTVQPGTPNQAGPGITASVASGPLAGTASAPQVPKKEIPSVAPPKVFGSTPPVPIEALVTSSAKPVIPTKPKEVWAVSPQDVNVRRALTRWADKAGWQVEWQASEDVLISSSASFEGDFKSAVDQLFGALTTTDVGLVPLRYKNKVIRVTESGKRAK